MVKELEAKGVRAAAFKADQANTKEVEALVKSVVERFGRLDILVNNAGVFVIGTVRRRAPTTLAEFERQFAINVGGVAAAVRAAAPYLGEGGRIISIGSVVGDTSPFPGIADYSATKAAVAAYTRGWARDLGRRGITVNNVQPGPIDTDMNPADGELRRRAAACTALGRYGKPEEVAAAVAFLASPAQATSPVPPSMSTAAHRLRLGLQSGDCHDRTQTFRRPWRRRPRLAQGQASFLLRPLSRPRALGALGPCACGTTTRSLPTRAFLRIPHADMEIITYVRQGAITHEDSLGNKGRTEAGDVQVMSAGSGIRHAEYNREDVPTHAVPDLDRAGGARWRAVAGAPSRSPSPIARAASCALASGFAGDDDALPIRAEARVLGATLKAGDTAEYGLGTEASRLSRAGAPAASR